MTPDPLHITWADLIDTIRTLEARVADLESRLQEGPRHEGYVTLRKYAEDTGIPIRTLYGYCPRRRNPLPSIKPGKKRMVKPAEASVWMEGKFNKC